MRTCACIAVAVWAAARGVAAPSAEEPLYWDFYRRQEIREMPMLEYDDVVPPYRKVHEFDVDKVEDAFGVPRSTPLAGRTVGFWAGRGSSAFVQFRHPGATGLAVGGWESAAVPLSGGGTEQRLNLSMGYTAFPGSVLADTAVRFAARRLAVWTTQTDWDLAVVQYAAPGLRLSYRPKLRFVHARESGFQKLFMEQEFRAAYVPSRTVGGGIAVVPVSLDGRQGIGYGVDATVRDWPWNGAGGTLAAMYRDRGDRPHADGLYHALTISQRVRWTTFSVSDARTADTDYLADYFLAWPDLSLERMRHEGADGHSTGVPDVRRSAASVVYARAPSRIQVAVERWEYSVYPTYEWSGVLVPVLAGGCAFFQVSAAVRTPVSGAVSLQVSGMSVLGSAPPGRPGYRVACETTVRWGRWSGMCTLLHEGGIEMLSPSGGAFSSGLEEPRTILGVAFERGLGNGVGLRIGGSLPLRGHDAASPTHVREPAVRCGVQWGW